MKNENSCKRILMNHARDVRDSLGADSLPWKERHVGAWNLPSTTSDVGVKHVLQGYAALADAYQETSPDRPLGTDGYFGEHAKDMLRAIHAWLNMGSGRLDNGAVSRLICQLAKASGVDENDL